MRIGVRKTRRVAAAIGISLVTLLATGTGANAAQLRPFTTFSQVGTGQVLGLQLKLPSTVVGTVNTLVGGVVGTIDNPIDEVVAYSQSLGQRASSLTGAGRARVFKGSLDTNLEKVAQAVFSRGLPVAEAILGGVEKVSDSLRSLNLPSDALRIIHAGVMEVDALSQKHPTVAGATKSSSTSRLVGLTIDLTQSIKDDLKEALSPVLGVTDGIDGGAGLLDTLNTEVLDKVEDIAADLGLEVNLNLPDLADLLDRPLLSIGLIETSSGADAVGIARNAIGRSKIVNLNILGTSADNALVHVDSLESTAFAQIDGTAGGAKADAVHKIVGLSVLDNELQITNEQIKVLGKTLPLPVDVVNRLTDVIGGTLGLEIKVLETQETKSATYARSIANTLRISFHPTIAGLGEQLGLDLTTPSAMAEVSGEIEGLKIAAGCPGGVCPTTGVADNAFLLAGPALIGMAILVRKFALAR